MIKQESKKEGIAIGEQQAKQEVALNLLRIGMTVEQVAAATGLAREQVQQLQGDRRS